MKVIAKKNRCINKHGQKKVRILTAGKVYNVVNTKYSNSVPNQYLIKDDIGHVTFYSERYFIPINKHRENILNKLGLC